MQTHIIIWLRGTSVYQVEDTIVEIVTDVTFIRKCPIKKSPWTPRQSFDVDGARWTHANGEEQDPHYLWVTAVNDDTRTNNLLQSWRYFFTLCLQLLSLTPYSYARYKLYTSRLQYVSETLSVVLS